jgi:CubicO group peptidase (beta-lactamase class C family)
MEACLKLPRSTPEAQGIDSGAIVRFLEEIGEHKLELHSMMLLRHGNVVAEGWWAPYRREDRHQLFSLSKSFTSTAIGLAQAEKLLSLDDRVISFFPDDLPEKVSPQLADMRIRHLLMMGTGHANDTMEALHADADGNWVKGFLSVPVEHQLGSHFVYNTGATYMLAAILHKVTGQFLLDYLEPRLLAPLGITGAVWERCPRGIATGGFGLSITTEDIAKFGQLYLCKGVWNGRRLLPEGWVEGATSKQIFNGDGGDSDWNQGYGYQFWRCRHGAYRGDGAFGQFCIVLPEQDAVVAITSGTGDMQGVLNAVWTHLLPAMEGEPLREDPSAVEELLGKLGGLHYDPPVAEASPAGEKRLHGQSYRLGANPAELEEMGYHFAERELTLRVSGKVGEAKLILGRESWQISMIPGSPDLQQRVAGSFTWRDEQTLMLTLRYVETPFTFTLACRPEEDGITFEFVPNLGFTSPAPITFRGELLDSSLV